MLRHDLPYATVHSPAQIAAWGRLWDLLLADPTQPPSPPPPAPLDDPPRPVDRARPAARPHAAGPMSAYQHRPQHVTPTLPTGEVRHVV